MTVILTTFSDVVLAALFLVVDFDPVVFFRMLEQICLIPWCCQYMSFYDYKKMVDDDRFDVDDRLL